MINDQSPESTPVNVNEKLPPKEMLKFILDENVLGGLPREDAKRIEEIENQLESGRTKTDQLPSLTAEGERNIKAYWQKVTDELTAWWQQETGTSLNGENIGAFLQRLFGFSKQEIAAVENLAFSLGLMTGPEIVSKGAKETWKYAGEVMVMVATVAGLIWIGRKWGPKAMNKLGEAKTAAYNKLNQRRQSRRSGGLEKLEATEQEGANIRNNTRSKPKIVTRKRLRRAAAWATKSALGLAATGLVVLTLNFAYKTPTVQGWLGNERIRAAQTIETRNEDAAKKVGLDPEYKALHDQKMWTLITPDRAKFEMPWQVWGFDYRVVMWLSNRGLDLFSPKRKLFWDKVPARVRPPEKLFDESRSDQKRREDILEWAKSLEDVDINGTDVISDIDIEIIEKILTDDSLNPVAFLKATEEVSTFGSSYYADGKSRLDKFDERYKFWEDQMNRLGWKVNEEKGTTTLGPREVVKQALAENGGYKHRPYGKGGMTREDVAHRRKTRQV